MSRAAVVALDELDEGYVLAPERYDPQRRPAGPEDGTRLSEVVELVNEQLNAKTAHPDGQYLVLDTSDARRGIVSTSKSPVCGPDIGSNKKRLQPGDVIISRLRPYLRQVAYIDANLARESIDVLCSTEFFVLRSRDESSVAFLVPFLLSDPVQLRLAAAQEGGHHPRFNAATLSHLRVPRAVMKRRHELSEAVGEAIQSVRGAEITLADAIRATVIA
jgi:hypothetical protein